MAVDRVQRAGVIRCAHNAKYRSKNLFTPNHHLRRHIVEQRAADTTGSAIQRSPAEPNAPPIMAFTNDVLNSVVQVRQLEMLGDKGIYAFEPFSSILNSWSVKKIENELRHSIALLQA